MIEEFYKKKVIRDFLSLFTESKWKELLFLIAEYGIIILKRNHNIAALSIEDLTNIIDELKEEDQKNQKKLNKRLEGKSLQTSYNEAVNIRENIDTCDNTQQDNCLFINPKPRSDWRKGDKTVFDKRRASRSASERKDEYRSNLSQQQSKLENYNNLDNNNNICYTENSCSGNYQKNSSNNTIDYLDVNVNNMLVQTTMHNRSPHNENNSSESHNNSRHKRRDSSISRSQNFEGSKSKLNKEVYPKWWADPTGIAPIKNKNKNNKRSNSRDTRNSRDTSRKQSFDSTSNHQSNILHKKNKNIQNSNSNLYQTSTYHNPQNYQNNFNNNFNYNTNTKSNFDQAYQENQEYSIQDSNKNSTSEYNIHNNYNNPNNYNNNNNHNKTSSKNFYRSVLDNMNNISTYNNNPNSRRISRSVSRDFSNQKFNNNTKINGQHYKQTPVCNYNTSNNKFNNINNREIESKIKDKVENDKKMYKILKQQSNLINRIKEDNVSNINQNTQEIFYTEEDLHDRRERKDNKPENLDNSYNNPNHNVNVSNLNNYYKNHSPEEDNSSIENSAQITSRIRQEGYVLTLMDKSQISQNSNVNQRNQNINTRQNEKNIKHQIKDTREKKNYVIEFNKADLKPHLILEKETKAPREDKNQSQGNIYKNQNNHLLNHLNNQEIVRESNNFYYNEDDGPLDYDNESNFNQEKKDSSSKKNSGNNTNILNNSQQQRFNYYDSISNSNLNLNNNNNDETMYKEQMLINYQIKRCDSNNFGNLNNDYSRFSDNNVPNLNQKNQQLQPNYNDNNSNKRNNNSSIIYGENNSAFEAQNDYYNHYNYNNNHKIINQNYQQHPNIITNTAANNINNNMHNFNLGINTINSTNRSSDFTNDKSVLFSPHFNQVNNQNNMLALAQYQQNPNNNLNFNAVRDANLIEVGYAKKSDRETPNRKDISRILNQHEVEDERSENISNIASRRNFDMESNITNKFSPPERNFSSRSEFKSNRLNQEFNSSHSTNREIIKTTDTSTSKYNTIPVDNNKERINQENNKNKYITLNNNFDNGSNNTFNQIARNTNNLNGSRKETKIINLPNQVNETNYNNNIYNLNDHNYINNDDDKNNNLNINPDQSKNHEYFMNKFKQNDISYSEMDDSKISESDKLSSYAPSERTKNYFEQMPIDIQHVNRTLNINGNFSDKDLRSSQKLKENLTGGNYNKNNIKANQLNQIQIDNIDKSLEDDTFVENRNMKLNSK